MALHTEVKCRHCGKWFPSPFQFGDKASFENSTLTGNMAQCPHCGKMTSCDKEDMRQVDK